MKETIKTLGKAVTAYEKPCCKAMEIRTQGVICASNGGGDGLNGGLDPYNGEEL